MKRLVNHLGLHHDKTRVYYDSLTAIFLAKDQVHHEMTKQIHVKYHFLRSERRIKVNKVGTLITQLICPPSRFRIASFKHCLDLLNVRFVDCPFLRENSEVEVYIWNYYGAYDTSIICEKILVKVEIC